MSVKVRQFKRGGWEVDVHVTLPDGQRIRERRKVHVSSKSAAKRWGEERQNFLAAKGNEKKEEVPSLAAFSPRYIEQQAKANRQKHSTIVQKERIIEHYLKPRLGRKRLGDISDADVQRIKADLLERSAKTVNNVASDHHAPANVGAWQFRLRRAGRRLFRPALLLRAFLFRWRR